MRLYNKLHKNITKVVTSGLCKKIEVIFTGLGGICSYSNGL